MKSKATVQTHSPFRALLAALALGLGATAVESITKPSLATIPNIGFPLCISSMRHLLP
jgi:hypothetical protein